MSNLDFIIHLRTLSPEEQLAAIEAWREPGPVPITSQAQAAAMLAEASGILEHVYRNGGAYFHDDTRELIDHAMRDIDNIAALYQEGNISMPIHFEVGNVVVTHHNPTQMKVIGQTDEGKILLSNNLEYRPSELWNVFEIGDGIGFTTALTPEQAQSKVDRAIDIHFYGDLEPGFYSGMGVKQKKS